MMSYEPALDGWKRLSIQDNVPFSIEIQALTSTPYNDVWAAGLFLQEAASCLQT